MSTLIYSTNWLQRLRPSGSIAHCGADGRAGADILPGAGAGAAVFAAALAPSCAGGHASTDAWSRQLSRRPLRCRSHSSPNGCPHGDNCCAHDRAAAGPGTGRRAGRPADAGAKLRQQCGAHSACGEGGCTARRRTTGMHNTCLGQCLPRLCLHVRWHSMQPSHQHRGLSRRLEIDEHINGADRSTATCCRTRMSAAGC